MICPAHIVGSFTMNEKKPSTKLLTRKQCIWLTVAVILGCAIAKYGDYKRIGHLEIGLVRDIIPMIIVIVFTVAILYRVNRR